MDTVQRLNKPVTDRLPVVGSERVTVPPLIGMEGEPGPEPAWRSPGLEGDPRLVAIYSQGCKVRGEFQLDASKASADRRRTEDTSQRPDSVPRPPDPNAVQNLGGGSQRAKIGSNEQAEIRFEYIVPRTQATPSEHAEVEIVVETGDSASFGIHFGDLDHSRPKVW